VRHLSWIGVLALTTACNSILGIGGFDVGPADDVPPPSDSFVPPDLAPGCFGVLAPYCDPIDMMTPVVSLSSMDTGVNCPQVFQPSTGGGEVCVITGSSIDVDASIIASITGPRPLMLVALDTITVSGVIDVSSRLRGQVGAGALDMCAAGAGASMNSGGGGGGGGGFGGDGADGGLGAQGAPPGKGSLGLQTPMFLRPGCGAGVGGDGSATGSGGIGGLPGGVVYLVAVNPIDIRGAVLASGAGGAGANQNGGNRGAGGGGGSGGLIALESQTISVEGTLQANGGGGGGGGDAGQGMDGADGTTQPFDSPAVGGMSEAPGKGGRGGSGGAGNNPAQPGLMPVQGGGGGGGGGATGYIWVRGELVGGGNNLQSSPPPTLVP